MDYKNLNFKDKSFDEITKLIKDKYNNSMRDFMDDIKDKVPFFDKSHSGNSLVMSWRLFGVPCFFSRIL